MYHYMHVGSCTTSITVNSFKIIIIATSRSKYAEQYGMLHKNSILSQRIIYTYMWFNKYTDVRKFCTHMLKAKDKTHFLIIYEHSIHQYTVYTYLIIKSDKPVWVDGTGRELTINFHQEDAVYIQCMTHSKWL